MYFTEPSYSGVEVSRSPKSKRVLLGLVVACTSMSVGMNQGFVTAAVPQLKGVSLSDISWFASLCGFVAPLGSLGVGIIIDKFGRRAALLWGIVPSLFGWTSIYLSKGVPMLLTGRVLLGLTYGALLYPAQVYAAECILVDHQRLLDSFKIWTGVASAAGGLSCMLLSRFFDYRQLAGILIALTFIEFLLVLKLLPESPVWLISQGRYGDAEWSQKRLGIHTSILWEKRERGANTSARFSVSADKFPRSKLKYGLEKIKRKDVYKPLIRTVILFTLILASGCIPISVYMINIIGNPPTTEESVRELVDPDNVRTSKSLEFSTVCSALSLLTHIALSMILPYLSIRSISIPCLFGMTIALAVLGCTSVVNSAELYLIHLASVWVVTLMFNFGVYNLPGALLGYVFPVDAKGFASIGSAVYVLLSAITLKIHPYLESAFGGYTFYGYAAFSLSSAIFAIFFMPETVGKSQQEIKDNFDGNSRTVVEGE